MRPWLMMGALVAVPLMFSQYGDLGSVGAEELTPAQQEAVQKAVDRILQEKGMTGGGTPPSTGGERKNLEDIAAEKRADKTKYGSSTLQGSGSLLYSRPFVASPKAILGGYMDIEYINRAHAGGTKSNKFDQHRLVPFIYGDVSDHVKVAIEIEIEHGNQLGVEFAAIDYLVNDPINFRAGLLLLPLGKFNLLHDAPMRDLTDRPIVDNKIIPVVLRQAGAGVYGTMYPSRLSKLDYEFYVTSGFVRFSGATSPITEENGIRNARSSNTDTDNNFGKSVVGRVAFSPVLGVEVGGSGFFGSYDPKSKRSLSVFAVDGTLQRGPFEILGEAAWAYAKDNHLKLDGTPDIDGATGRPKPRRMSGYYVQANYHFLPAFLTRLAPSHFRPEVSTFTAVVRWGEANTNKDINGGFGEFQRLTFGLNYRPTEDTVFKTEFQYSPEAGVNDKDQRIHDTAFLASWATYF